MRRCSPSTRISSHLSLNHEGRWGTIDDFVASFLHFSLFSTALWDLANSRPVHSLMLSSSLLLCLPCLLPPLTVPCKTVLARPDEQETWPYTLRPIKWVKLNQPFFFFRNELTIGTLEYNEVVHDRSKKRKATTTTPAGNSALKQQSISNQHVFKHRESVAAIFSDTGYPVWSAEWQRYLAQLEVCSTGS